MRYGLITRVVAHLKQQVMWYTNLHNDSGDDVSCIVTRLLANNLESHLQNAGAVTKYHK